MDISNAHINGEELASLELKISGVGYLEKSLFCFTKISTEFNHKFEADAKELKSVSNFKKEKKNKKIQ